MASPPSRGLSHTAILPPLELEPRTTRARSKAGESSSSTLPGAEGDSSLSRRLENAWKRRKKPTPLKKSYKGKLGNCPSPPSCASGMVSFVFQNMILDPAKAGSFDVGGGGLNHVPG
eukprot:sb/3476571/